MRRERVETIRRVRLGDLRRVLRDRWGHELSDDDAGRDALMDLLALSKEKNRRHVIEISAPWMDAAEVEIFLAATARTPVETSPQALGEKHRLTHAERERLRVWQIAPCDVSKRELAEHRRAKKRSRDRARRRKQGAMPRQQYLENSISRRRPWVAEGMSRASWYRKKAKSSEINPRSEQKPTETSARQAQNQGETSPRQTNTYSEVADLSHASNGLSPNQEHLSHIQFCAGPAEAGRQPPSGGNTADDVQTQLLKSLARFLPENGDVVVRCGDENKRMWRDKNGVAHVDDCGPF